MATSSRITPEKYFSWYNDDNRIAIVESVTDPSSSLNNSDTWDTYQGDGDLTGTIRTATNNPMSILSSGHGLVTGDRIKVIGTTSYDGNYTITRISDNTFTIVVSASSGSAETGSWESLWVDNGFRITYHSRYENVSSLTDDLKTDIGLDESMHHALVYYIKYRLMQDMVNFEQAEYSKQLFDETIKKFPSRKTGVRFLATKRI